VLISGNLPVGRLLRNGCRVLQFVEGKLKSDLATRMLTLGLSGADTSEDAQLEQLISESITLLAPHGLVALATPLNAKRERLSNNIVLLDRADSKIRRIVLAEIEDLSDRLIVRRRHSITKELVQAWAHLLADSGSVNRRAQMNAAGNVLSFALEERDKPVSPLIAVAFPIVYAELGAGHETPGLFSFIFTDWDRCKTARKKIVEAFLRSSWPTVDLINAVAPTGDLGRVLERLLDDRDGESFLKRLRQDLTKLPTEERTPMEKAMSKALNGLGTK